MTEELLDDLLTSTGKKMRIVTSSSHDNIHSIVLQISDSNNELMEKVKKTILQVDPKARYDVFYPDHQLGGY